jgi:hypothetical protein
VADTTYIVLRRDDDGGGIAVDRWQTDSRVEAVSAEAAIRKAEPKAGTYVAVPARSWKPVTVRTETTTTIRLDTPTPEQ